MCLSTGPGGNEKSACQRLIRARDFEKFCTSMAGCQVNFSLRLPSTAKWRFNGKPLAAPPQPTTF